MIIEIRMKSGHFGTYEYSKPLNKDIAWENAVSYFDCLNRILYPSQLHPTAHHERMDVEALNAWKRYQNEKA